MTLKYFPTEKMLVNPETGKRLATFDVDGTQYVSVYGIILLLGVYRGYAAQFVVHRLNLCFELKTGGRGRPTFCVLAKNWTRVVDFVTERQARKGITVTPCIGAE